MWIFTSQLEDVISVGELDFPPTPAFGRWGEFFPEEAVAHPAKANLNLIKFLVEKFTKVGDVVLDPFAGTYSTCVVASLMGRNSVGVEIEEKFYKWGLEAKRRVESYPSLTPKGWMVVLRGDARELSKLIREANTIITSPPYSRSISFKAGGPTKVKRVGISTITARNYGYDPKNIGNLPHGEIDAIITSPPYENTARRPGNLEEMRDKLSELYPGHVGRFTCLNATEYSNSKRNIGNLKGETYLNAMYRVYSECFKVLKPDGKMITIIKPFIRNKKVVDLPWETYLLLSRAGFELELAYKLLLKRLSFWRLQYYRKYPEVPMVKHEYVLVCRKPS